MVCVKKSDLIIPLFDGTGYNNQNYKNYLKEVFKNKLMTSKNSPKWIWRRSTISTVHL